MISTTLHQRGDAHFDCNERQYPHRRLQGHACPRES